LSQAAEYARIDNRAFRVLKTYLPGAFTFILPASTTLPKVFKGRKSVGVRIPDNDIARALAEAMGNPILSTSIEFDADQPAEAELPDAIALRYSNDIDLMIDGGEGTTFVSTVVDLSDSSSPELVRQGLGEFED
jgi:tRNA threonylcarbamoyl adenosine modification protein (Sua5/YciO/YrdC/YwlC family)